MNRILTPFVTSILAGIPVFLSAAAPVIAQEKGTVVEEIVARVNNQIITRSDLQKADSSLREELTHEERELAKLQGARKLLEAQ